MIQQFKELREVFLPFANIIVPIFFVWHTELILNNPHVQFTNGFATFDKWQIYHVLMYFMFASAWLSSFQILKNRLKNTAD